MSEAGRPKSSAAVRPPLGDATYRINNNLPNTSAKSPKSHGPEANGARIDPVVSLINPNIEMPDEPTVSEPHAPDGGHTCAAPPPGPQPRHPRTRAVQETDPSKRVSQASTAPSSNRSSNCSYKTQVGPWQLGKTLGKGSSARVRLCRHRLSGELAAVKIIPKKTAYLIQHGSLAALHQYDDSLPDRIDGEMRVPMSIEREVAILKLVDHPNVMKVYDIWENRSEIYLVLEYVDKGDLFDYINTNGRLNEEAAMYFFRQIMSAMQHCHAFNICHRDLKPENILLNAENQIKIADFGMAALHQSEGHRLETACGSPHYAAPELLKNKHYRGDRADVWSMGVILYAILAARLPFDDPDIRVLLARTKKGIYEMPECLSPEAKDLICRMLQVNPDIRISLKDMWRHPLIRKYDYLDNFGTKVGQPRNIREGFDYTPLKPQEVDDHLVRQLRSLWHMFSEHQIKLMLLDSSKNDQKLFYWLLQQYRQKQLENFLPEVSQSPSDYHHLHQPAWKKRVSTCEFTQPRAHGPGRSISKFTVISNVPDTDVGTVKSYDPYNSSRPMPSAVEGAGLRQVYMHGAIHDDEPPAGLSASRISSHGADSVRKKKSWFKRSAKEDDQREASIRTKQTSSSRETTDTRPCTMATQSTIDYSTEATSPSRHHSGPLSPPQKKKSFGLLFWKSNKAENRMSIAGPDYEDSPSPESRKTGRSKASQHGDQSITESDSGVRKIEVHQTWLARLFGVKPVTSHMCLVVSRKRARQELAILLKDWRRYGIRDIQVDKERNVVFARIGSKNYLNIKEVSFAMEIMTVIEHGKRGSLSIVRFTQERGAASSFQKVVDTIKSVFGSRHLLVTDKRKSKMMIKTLNS
ncbi:serine/threonine-protein kinase HSL1 like [Verticillium longisporum]|nr:serine/threonine-protein kinase HSL1 like [Verticillium longisporum]